MVVKFVTNELGNVCPSILLNCAARFFGRTFGASKTLVNVGKNEKEPVEGTNKVLIDGDKKRR
jgi:hypothetical protein